MKLMIKFSISKLSNKILAKKSFKRNGFNILWKKSKDKIDQF